MTVTGRSSRRWRKVAVAIAASVAILAPGFPGGAASAAPSQPFDACPDAFPVADLTPGMVASGLTVEKGNVADPFTATVLGVIDDGIAPGLDMIIVETDSPAIQRAGGVWAGMSGSPVYAPDGRLIGAVAFGLAFGSSNIAGVTPAADMKALLTRPGPTPSPAAKVALPAALERRLVASGAATRAEAASGMRQLPIPLGVSGVNPGHFGKVAERLEKELPGTRVYAAAAAPVGATASPADIFPGSNFAAAISYGDLTAAGVGTTTAVCTVGTDDFALAFGHPFTFLGATSLSVHSANAVFVQPDILVPFKVANPGGVVGTLDQDRLAGIRGLLGPVPPAIPVDSTVTSTDDGASRSGTTRVNLQQFVPDIAAFHLLANLDRVFDRIGGGTSQLRWVINGTRASGAPFSVDVTNMYANTFDVTFESIFDPFFQLFAIDSNRFDDAKITGVQFTGSVSSTFTQYSLDSVLVRRPDGTLVPPPTDRPLRVVAGSRLNLRVVLVPYRNIGPVRNVDLSVVVPPDTAGGFGSVQVLGGPGFDSGDPEGPASFDELLAQLRGLVPNNAVTAALRVGNFTPGGFVERRRTARQLVDKVVIGDSSLDIQVVAPRRARPGVVDGNVWKLRSSLSGGPATTTFTFGAATDRKLMGDWDGNGSLSAAVFRNGTWIVRPSGTFAPPNFTFGQAGDIPVAGDWDGDGRDGIGVYRGGRWLLRNSLSAGPADLDFIYGDATQRPVVGDWNGDGIDSVGTFLSGTWSVRNTNSAGPPASVFTYGRIPGDKPVVGEWDGDGRDEAGVYRAGRWLLRNTLNSGPPSLDFTFGGASSRPVVWG